MGSNGYILLLIVIACVIALIYISKKRKALEAGVRAMLRNDIIKLADKYLDEGEIPFYGLENLNGMYDAYHTLGGNGTVTKLVEEVRRLPTRH